MRFVLASASPARLSVLRSAGIDPVVQVSRVDEHAVLAEASADPPEVQVSKLAGAKADAVVPEFRTAHGTSVVVGCDSMLHTAEGDTVGKPETPEAAKLRWRGNAGSTGTLVTGHAVVRIDDGVPVANTHGYRTSTVRFGSPSETELDAYIATGEPLHVAGGFTLEGFGGWFIEGVDGDPSSVLGISLPLTRELLEDVGLSITALWRTG